MRRILLVEDDDFVCKIVAIILTKEAYHVTIAKNGKDAITYLKSSKFDLVISDMMLPYANGLELITEIRGNLHLDVPILVLSAVTHEKTIAEVFAIGGDDYLKKPFNPTELTSRINRLIGQGEKKAI